MTEAAAQLDTDATPQSDAAQAADPAETLYDAGKPPEQGEQVARPDEADAGKPADAKPDEATPAEIQDFAIPEGMTLDAELSDSLKALAKDKGWDQETAQAVADLGIKQAQSIEAALQASRDQTINGWAEQTKTDKEIGANLEANVALAAKARDAFSTPEFAQFLNESGLGNHPEMIRTFMRIGQKISEDTIEGKGSDTPPADPAKRLFPDMN